MKMTISRDVARDLWPAYRSGEASEDTKTLMAEYLASDPDFAASLEGSDTEFPRAASAPAMAPDAARAMISRTKTLLRRRTLFVALAIIFLAIPPAIRSVRLRFPEMGTSLFGSTPWQWENAVSLACIATSAALWIAYLAVRRRLLVRGF